MHKISQTARAGCRAQLSEITRVAPPPQGDVAGCQRTRGVVVAVVAALAALLGPAAKACTLPIPLKKRR